MILTIKKFLNDYYENIGFYNPENGTIEIANNSYKENYLETSGISKINHEIRSNIKYRNKYINILLPYDFINEANYLPNNFTYNRTFTLHKDLFRDYNLVRQHYDTDKNDKYNLVSFPDYEVIASNIKLIKTISENKPYKSDLILFSIEGNYYIIVINVDSNKDICDEEYYNKFILSYINGVIKPVLPDNINVKELKGIKPLYNDIKYNDKFINGVKKTIDTVYELLIYDSLLFYTGKVDIFKTNINALYNRGLINSVRKEFNDNILGIINIVDGEYTMGVYSKFDEEIYYIGIPIKRSKKETQTINKAKRNRAKLVKYAKYIFQTDLITRCKNLKIDTKSIYIDNETNRVVCEAKEE